MTDHVLVVPNVGSAEVEADFGSEGVDAPVSREREVTSIVEDIHAMNPQSDRKHEERPPLASEEGR